jgi:hypothetical protein
MFLQNNGTHTQDYMVYHVYGNTPKEGVLMHSVPQRDPRMVMDYHFYSFGCGVRLELQASLCSGQNFFLLEA